MRVFLVTAVGIGSAYLAFKAQKWLNNKNKKNNAVLNK